MIADSALCDCRVHVTSLYRHEYFRDRDLGLRRLAFSNRVEDAVEKQFDSESK